MSIIRRSILPFSAAPPVLSRDLRAGAGAIFNYDSSGSFSTEHFSRGTLLIERDTPGSIVRVLVSGKAAVISIGGRRRIGSRRVRNGELLGLTEVLSHIPYSVTVKALTSCVCLSVGIQEIDSSLRESMLLRNLLLQTLSCGYIAAFAEIRSIPTSGDLCH